jgi:low temperature requirement protein LtrA
VAHAHDPADFVRAFLVLSVTWWMYGGYAWLTNNVDVRGTATRLLLLGGMAGFLVMGLATPRVAEGDGTAFGVAYLAVVALHAALFRCAPNPSARAILRVAPFNVAGALFVIVAGLGPREWSLPLWVCALAVPLAATIVGAERGFSLRAGHFAERHGLIILIALGESVVGIGAGAAGVPVRLPLVTAAVLSLALAAGLWWTYFDRDDRGGEHAMARAAGEQRARLGLYAYGFAHLAMIAGIVTAAAGVEEMVAGLTHPPAPAAPWLLAAGVAAYLAGEALFRRLVGLDSVAHRLIAALLALGTTAVGSSLPAVAQLALLDALIIVMLIAEKRRAANPRIASRAAGRTALS